MKIIRGSSEKTAIDKLLEYEIKHRRSASKSEDLALNARRIRDNYTETMKLSNDFSRIVMNEYLGNHQNDPVYDRLHKLRIRLMGSGIEGLSINSASALQAYLTNTLHDFKIRNLREEQYEYLVNISDDSLINRFYLEGKSLSAPTAISA